METSKEHKKTWTFLTNHARVLIRIARSPSIRMRDVAQEIGITERAAQLIIGDLEEAGYLTRTRVGRRNTYTVNPDLPFRHPVEADHDIRDLLDLFTDHAGHTPH
ncbi:helix-turn-helix transcriptional regulator [Spirillospora sp. CA-255316]